MDGLTQLSDSLVDSVRKCVERATSPLIAEIAALKKQIAEIPSGAPGERGERGERGEKGEKGEPGNRGADGAQGPMGPRGERGADGERGVPGERGLDGSNGKDGRDGINGKDGKDGVNGKDFDPTEMHAAITKAVSEIPRPKDGESVHPDTVALMVREAVDKAVAAVRLPKDGEPGRDALDIDILEDIDETRSYPIGTFAKYRGGLVKAERHTDPLTEGFARSGWSVIVDGIADIACEWTDERTSEIRVVRTSGEETVTSRSWPLVLDRGVYKTGSAYRPGDGVTWGGSFWIAQKDTTDKPGTSAGWRLAVKAGRDAK